MKKRRVKTKHIYKVPSTRMPSGSLGWASGELCTVCSCVLSFMLLNIRWVWYWLVWN